MTDGASGLPAEAERALLDNRARFLAFLEPRVGSKALAEELLQDAYARALDRRGQLRDDETVVAWFFRILRNAVTDRRRRNAAEGRALERLAREVEGSGIPQDEVRDAVCTCVTGVLDALKPEYQDSLRAVDLAGEPLQAFAERTGITPNNAAVRLHRARAALGRGLRQTCGACAEHGCVDCTCHRGR